MRAVQFGAGNIGRGFVAQFLHESGYEVVFADVNAEIVGQLNATDAYRVHEIGGEGRTLVVDGFRAIDSRTDEALLVEEIASADVVTTAVGPRILPFIAPVIAKGIQRRMETIAEREAGGRLVVLACENAIGATDLLRAEIVAALAESEGDALSSVAVFANTAIDRIVPQQADDAGLDVTIESFFEWVVDGTPFGDDVPPIAGIHWVDDLEPFIERKLFTVNTGHAAAAYHGFAAGIGTIAEALADPRIRGEVEAAIGETRTLLVAKHGLDEVEQRAYGEKILARLSNPELPDTVDRVGRAPLRKLSRRERFVGPAAELAERGLDRSALVRAVRATLDFDVPADEESVELQRLLAEEEASDVVVQVTGVTPGHPVFDELLGAVTDRQRH